SGGTGPGCAIFRQRNSPVNLSRCDTSHPTNRRLNKLSRAVEGYLTSDADAFVVAFQLPNCRKLEQAWANLAPGRDAPAVITVVRFYRISNALTRNFLNIPVFQAFCGVGKGTVAAMRSVNFRIKRTSFPRAGSTR